MCATGPDVREILFGDSDGLFHLLLGLEKSVVNHCGSSVPVCSVPVCSVPVCSVPVCAGGVPSVPVPAYQSPDRLAPYGLHYVALAHQVEHDYWQIIVHAQANRRSVHELQLPAQDVRVVELVEHVRVRGVARIGVVDALDLGALEHRLGAYLERALGRAGVGGEKWSTEPRAEDNDPALLQVPDRTPRYVRLGYLTHRDRGLNARLDAQLLEHVLQGQAVDNGAEHPHVVRPGPVDTPMRERGTAEHVAATDHDRHLHSEPPRVGDLAGQVRHHVRVDAEPGPAGEGLPRKLEHYAVPAEAPIVELAGRLG